MNGVRISGSLIPFLLPSIALDFLAELGYKGLFKICICNSTKMQKGSDLIIPWRKQNTTIIAQYKLSLRIIYAPLCKILFLVFGNQSKKSNVYWGKSDPTKLSLAQKCVICLRSIFPELQFWGSMAAALSQHVLAVGRQRKQKKNPKHLTTSSYNAVQNGNLSHLSWDSFSMKAKWNEKNINRKQESL